MIERVCADLGESYDEISILDDPALLERYAEEIPVTLVDGKQHDFWRVARSGCGWPGDRPTSVSAHRGTRPGIRSPATDG